VHSKGYALVPLWVEDVPGSGTMTDDVHLAGVFKGLPDARPGGGLQVDRTEDVPATGASRTSA
jgi:hypothetical protein